MTPSKRAARRLANQRSYHHIEDANIIHALLEENKKLKAENLKLRLDKALRDCGVKK